MKTDLFQSCSHCWVFPICWHIECSTLTAPSFRVWNSSIGIPSPPLSLFVVMLLKAHLTLHSRMCSSRWVIILSWLFASWRSFLKTFFCVSLWPHLSLVSSASVRSIPFLSFIVPIFAWNVPLVSLTFLRRPLVFYLGCLEIKAILLDLFRHSRLICIRRAKSQEHKANQISEMAWGWGFSSSNIPCVQHCIKWSIHKNSYDIISLHKKSSVNNTALWVDFLYSRSLTSSFIYNLPLTT